MSIPALTASQFVGTAVWKRTEAQIACSGFIVVLFCVDLPAVVVSSVLSLSVCLSVCLCVCLSPYPLLLSHYTPPLLLGS